MINGETQQIENAYNRFPGINLYNKAWITAFQKSCQETSQKIPNGQHPHFFLMISGSRGRGTAHPNSDIDTLTIVPTIQDMNSTKPGEVTSTILSGLKKHFIEIVEGDLTFSPLKNWLGLLVDVNKKTEQKLEKIRKTYQDTTIEPLVGMKVVLRSDESKKAISEHITNDPAISYRAFKRGIRPTLNSNWKCTT